MWPESWMSQTTSRGVWGQISHSSSSTSTWPGAIRWFVTQNQKSSASVWKRAHTFQNYSVGDQMTCLPYTINKSRLTLFRLISSFKWMYASPCCHINHADWSEPLWFRNQHITSNSARWILIIVIFWIHLHHTVNVLKGLTQNLCVSMQKQTFLCTHPLWNISALSDTMVQTQTGVFFSMPHLLLW